MVSTPNAAVFAGFDPSNTQMSGLKIRAAAKSLNDCPETRFTTTASRKSPVLL